MGNIIDPDIQHIKKIKCNYCRLIWKWVQNKKIYPKSKTNINAGKIKKIKKKENW